MRPVAAGSSMLEQLQCTAAESDSVRIGPLGKKGREDIDSFFG